MGAIVTALDLDYASYKRRQQRYNRQIKALGGFPLEIMTKEQFAKRYA